MQAALCLVICAAVLAVSGCSPSAGPPGEATTPGALENGAFTARLNGFDIHYEVHGQGPVLMVVPNSWGLSLGALRNFLNPLEERLTLVYFDPRGMGESDEIREDSDMGMAAVRADFQALRQHLGLDSVNVIGWSNGAMNLVYLAAEKPETINRAIFLHGAASFTEEDEAAFEAQHPDVTESWKTLQHKMMNPDLTAEQKTQMLRVMWLEEWFPLSFADRAAAADTLDRIFGDAEFSWTHAEYSQRESPTFDARDQLQLITARCLVIAGAHDLLPPSAGEELAAGIADAQYVVFESSGHYAPAEQPEDFRRLVFGFLGVD